MKPWAIGRSAEAIGFRGEGKPWAVSEQKEATAYRETRGSHGLQGDERKPQDIGKHGEATGYREMSRSHGLQGARGRHRLKSQGTKTSHGLWGSTNSSFQLEHTQNSSMIRKSNYRVKISSPFEKVNFTSL